MSTPSPRTTAPEARLTPAEKEAIIRHEYAPQAHRIGLTFALLHIVIFFLPPLYITLRYNLPTDWSAVGRGMVGVLGFSIPFWLIEPISYFVVLGISGTYISFLAGNISNFRLPVSAVAQEAVGVREGSHEGEIVSTLAIVATQVMLVTAALSGAIFVTAVVRLLPAGLVAAFDWLLPSIWGAIVVQFALRRWPYAVVAIAVSVYVDVYSPLPTWLHIPVIVFFMAFLSLRLYSRGLWLIARKDRTE